LSARIFAFVNQIDDSSKIIKVFESSYGEITKEFLGSLDSVFEFVDIQDNPFVLTIFLINYFSNFTENDIKGYLSLNEILMKRKSNLRSSAIATVAIMQKLGWDVQLFYNEKECYLGLNLSEDWKVRKGTWIEKDGKKYYLKEYDTKTPVGYLKFDKPGSVYKSLKVHTLNLSPIPLIKSLPAFSSTPAYQKGLKWRFKDKDYQIKISIPVAQAAWTLNLPPSLYGMVASGIEELKNLEVIEKLKFLTGDFEEFDQVNFLLKFCQSEGVFFYDKGMAIRSITNQLIDGRNDCDGRSVFLYCLLRSMLDYPDSNIVFLGWKNHLALGLKPKTEGALLELKKSGIAIGDYFILDPAFLGDTQWGSRMKILNGRCEIIKIDKPSQ